MSQLPVERQETTMRLIIQVSLFFILFKYHECEIQFKFVQDPNVRVNHGVVLEHQNNPILVSESLWLAVNVSIKALEDHFSLWASLISDVDQVCDDFKLLSKGGKTLPNWTHSLNSQGYSHLIEQQLQYCPIQGTLDKRQPIREQFPKITRFINYINHGPQMQFARSNLFNNEPLSYDQLQELYDTAETPTDWMIMSEKSYFQYIGFRNEKNQHNFNRYNLPKPQKQVAENNITFLRSKRNINPILRDVYTPFNQIFQMCEETKVSLLKQFQIAARQILTIFEQHQIEPLDGVFRRLLLSDIDRFVRRKRRGVDLRDIKNIGEMVKSPTSVASKMLKKKMAVLTKRYRTLLGHRLIKSVGMGFLKVLGPVGSLITGVMVDRRIDKIEDAIFKQELQLYNMSFKLDTVELITAEQSIEIRDLQNDVDALKSDMGETKRTLIMNSILDGIVVQLHRIQNKAADLRQYIVYAIMDYGNMLQSIEANLIPFVIDHEIAIFMNQHRGESKYFAPNPERGIVMYPRYSEGNLRFYCNILIAKEKPWELWRVIPIPVLSSNRMYKRVLPYEYALINEGESRYIPLKSRMEINDCKTGVCITTRGPTYPLSTDKCGIGLMLTRAAQKKRLTSCKYERVNKDFFAMALRGGMVYSSPKDVKARLNCFGTSRSRIHGTDATVTLPKGSMFFKIPSNCEIITNDDPQISVLGQPKETVASIDEEYGELIGIDHDNKDTLDKEIENETNNDGDTDDGEKTKTSYSLLIASKINDKFANIIDQLPSWLRKVGIATLITLGICLFALLAYLCFTYCQHSWVATIVKKFRRFTRRAAKKYYQTFKIFRLVLEALSNVLELLQTMSSKLKEKGRNSLLAKKIENIKSEVQDFTDDLPRLGGRSGDESGEDSQGEEHIPEFSEHVGLIDKFKCCRNKTRYKDLNPHRSHKGSLKMKSMVPTGFGLEPDLIGETSTPTNVEIRAARSTVPLTNSYASSRDIFRPRDDLEDEEVGAETTKELLDRRPRQ